MTVNCPNCGGPISVSDEFCPYCGSPNQTKEKEKVKKAESKAALAKPLVLIIILIILNVIATAFISEAYGLGLDKKKAINEAHAEEIANQFQKYLADRDYLLAAEFYSSDDYYSLSTLKNYRMVTDALYNYAHIFYDIAPDEPSEYEAEALRSNAKSIGMHLSEIYEYPKKTYYDYVPTEDVIDITEDIISETEAIVAAAYHLTEEETAGLCDMKEDRVVELLEEASQRQEGETPGPKQEAE